MSRTVILNDDQSSVGFGQVELHLNTLKCSIVCSQGTFNTINEGVMRDEFGTIMAQVRKGGISTSMKKKLNLIGLRDELEVTSFELLEVHEDICHVVFDVWDPLVDKYYTFDLNFSRTSMGQPCPWDALHRLACAIEILQAKN